MITFFLIAGLMLVVAMAFALWPLIGKRFHSGSVSHGQSNLSIHRDQLKELDADLTNGTLDQAQYESAKLEIERRVLEEYEEDQSTLSGDGGPKWTIATTVAVMIPLATVSLYLALGNPVALEHPDTAAENRDAGHDLSPQQLARMVDGIKQRLRNNPDDVDGWITLAKTSVAIGRMQDAVDAYRELVKRLPPDAQLYADFADTLAMVNGRNLEGEPRQLIEQALKVDPKNVKALALAGTAEYRKEKFANAAEYWRRVLALVPQDAEFAERMRESIADAERQGGGGRKAGTQPTEGIGSSRVSGKVDIDSAVAKTISPDDTVFVFARAANGPKMPLAVARFRVGELPARFELNESMAVAPGMSIKQHSDLLVGARISKSGNAQPQAGDWESELSAVRLGSSDVSLVISRIVR